MSRPTFSAFELKPNYVYRVFVSFTDFDGGVHPVGESWCYESKNFLPYHAGLSLNVKGDNGLRCIRLQDYPEAQGDIVTRFSDFVKEETALPPLLRNDGLSSGARADAGQNKERSQGTPVAPKSRRPSS